MAASFLKISFSSLILILIISNAVPEPFGEGNNSPRQQQFGNRIPHAHPPHHRIHNQNHNNAYQDHDYHPQIPIRNRRHAPLPPIPDFRDVHHPHPPTHMRQRRQAERQVNDGYVHPHPHPHDTWSSSRYRPSPSDDHHSRDWDSRDSRDTQERDFDFDAPQFQQHPNTPNFPNPNPPPFEANTNSYPHPQMDRVNTQSIPAIIRLTTQSNSISDSVKLVKVEVDVSDVEDNEETNLEIVDDQ